MRIIHLLLLFCCTMTFLAHEFIAKKPVKRCSLQTLKQQWGDLLAEQLRESACIVELLGSVQTRHVEIEKDALLLASLKESAVTLQIYQMQLVDLLHQPKAVQPVVLFDNKSVSDVVASITTMVGKIQQHLIAYINDLIDDTGDLFVKKHLQELSDQLPTIKNYNVSLQRLKKILTDVECAPHNSSVMTKVTSKAATA